MATATAFRPIPDERLGELMELIGGSDSVELKLTVPDTSHGEAARALGMDPLDAEIRQVFFYDTPDLALYKQGVVVRSRRIQRKDGDAIVKLRPVIPHDLPEDLRTNVGFNVEVDAMPGGFVCSARLKRAVSSAEIREVAFGERPVRKLFSKTQRALFSEHAPDGPALDELSVLGPILTLKLKYAPEGFNRKLVAELWMYPDNSRVLELSTKCLPGEAFQVAAEARAFLVGHGVELGGQQEAKTKKALQYFSKHVPART